MTNLQFFCLKHYSRSGLRCINFVHADCCIQISHQRYISAVIHTALLNNARKVGRLVLSRTSCYNSNLNNIYSHWPHLYFYYRNVMYYTAVRHWNSRRYSLQQPKSRLSTATKPFLTSKQPAQRWTNGESRWFCMQDIIHKYITVRTDSNWSPTKGILDGSK
jgi:hypothetical protein